MKGDISCTGLGKIRNDTIYRLDHQVNIDVGGNAMLAQCLADQRTDRQVGNVMIVHDIEVHDIGAGIQYIGDFLPESGKIRRQYGRCDLVFGHVVVLTHYFKFARLQSKRALYPNGERFSAILHRRIRPA